jgi:hypothetical protein
VGRGCKFVNPNSDDPIYPGKSGDDDNDEEEIFSSKRHMMDYVTEDGIIKRTALTDKKYWYLLVIKELIDNAIDWLWKEYQGRDDSKITIEITLTKDNLFKCKVTNTNPDNIQIFSDKVLANIFDYEKTYGSKQNDFTIKRGAYGDASKYTLALAYVLTNLGRDKSNDFEDKQWEIPLYIRHNGIEQEIVLHVDEANNTIEAKITPADKARHISHTNTEVEVTYPIIPGIINGTSEEYEINGTKMISITSTGISIHNIKNYILDNIVGTTDISFEIKLIDKLVTNETIELEQKRTHPISDDWNSLPSIIRYTPQEFRKKIFGVDDKSKTIYQVLCTFKQGTQLKKTPDLDKPISSLLNDPKKVQALYYKLRNSRLGKKPPRKIVLPYSKFTTKATRVRDTTTTDDDDHEDDE